MMWAMWVFKHREVVHGATERLDVLLVTWKPARLWSPLPFRFALALELGKSLLRRKLLRHLLERAADVDRGQA